MFRAGEKDEPKKFLGVFMIFSFLLYCSHAVFFSNLYYLYSYIEFIYVFCMLSIYPMYFIYLQSLTTLEIKLNERLQHFIPAAFFGFLVLITSLILTPENRTIYVQEILINKNLKKLDISTFVGTKGVIFFLSRIAFLIQIGHYAFNGIKLANTHNEEIENYYSNTEGKTFHWVKRINIIILLVALTSITFTFIGRGFFSKNENFLIIPSAIFSSFLFFIGYKGNRQLRIISDFGEDLNFSDLNEINNNPNKKLVNRLIQLFEKEKIYRNPDLRITHISESLQTNRTYISKLINEEFEMNFNQFVNNFRINEAKKLLEEDNGKVSSMELIAEKSGFGSFNSFTRVFKNITGTTPGNFRNKSELNK